MIPTGQQIVETAQITFLGDTEDPGQLYPASILQHGINVGYRLLFSQMMRVDSRRARRLAYYNLPPFFNAVSPAAMGIANLGEPKEISERNVQTSWTGTIAAINAFTQSSPPSVDITIPSHGLAAGIEIVAFNFTGMTADMNDLYYIAVPDSNTIRLNGCSAEALTSGSPPDVGIGSTGIISRSTEDFPFEPNMTPMLDVLSYQTPNSFLGSWDWTGGVFKFPACSSARQIRVLYTISGEPPADLGASIGIDNSLDFLAAYSAALAANARGADASVGQALFTIAVGNPAGEPGDGDGGLLGQFLRPSTKSLQNIRVVIPPFRQKRNTGWWVNY